ncbi:hypothetical protein EDB89DRAFT_1080882 [Lactarius sanguifluus]|nr:hypothetical protein EDB89DRAFT_1080882 [Lactarius sanguifluus]
MRLWRDKLCCASALASALPGVLLAAVCMFVTVFLSRSSPSSLTPSMPQISFADNFVFLVFLRVLQ